MINTIEMHCIILPRQNRGGLYLGNLKCAQDTKNLQQYGINAVISVTSSKQVQFDSSILHLHLKVTDYESDQIQQFFDKSNKFLDINRKYTNVLVHCRMGVSRSATIVIAYLMYYKLMSLQKAFDYVKEIRSCIQPNKGFMTQLKKYETILELSRRYFRYDYIQELILLNQSSSRNTILLYLQINLQYTDISFQHLIQNISLHRALTDLIQIQPTNQEDNFNQKHIKLLTISVLPLQINLRNSKISQKIAL